MPSSIDNPRKSFLDLPGELRNKVYSYYFTETVAKTVPDMATKYRFHKLELLHRSRQAPPLLYVSRLISREARNYFLKTVVLRVKTVSPSKTARFLENAPCVRESLIPTLIIDLPDLMDKDAGRRIIQTLGYLNGNSNSQGFRGLQKLVIVDCHPKWVWEPDPKVIKRLLHVRHVLRNVSRVEVVVDLENYWSGTAKIARSFERRARPMGLDTILFRLDRYDPKYLHRIPGTPLEGIRMMMVIPNEGQ